MDIGLMMDCDQRNGQTEREAFDAALKTADLAEASSFDSLWLAERHFSPPGSTALLASVGSAPLLMATAIAMRTRRIRIGTAVLLLPLGHPIRLAEEVATLDHLSRGRLNLGIGRSSFPRAYDAYNVSYAESRARFQEYLEVMQLAWTQQRFSYDGTFYTYQDLEVIPKPYQQPHPPLHHAAASQDTFAAIGTAGRHLLVALIGTSLSELAPMVAEYQAAWRAAGHPGRGEVRLRLPIYVADTLAQARAEPQPSVVPYYERLRQGYLRSSQAYENKARAARAAQLATLTYDDLLQERLVFGTPGSVTDRLCALQQSLGLSGFIIEPNIGGLIPSERVAHSTDLFVHKVVPHLQETV